MSGSYIFLTHQRESELKLFGVRVTHGVYFLFMVLDTVLILSLSQWCVHENNAQLLRWTKV